LGKQYKKLTDDDIAFIEKQKIFYIASSSGKEVNLSPKGYDSIRVINSTKLIFLNLVGSGNRTNRDSENNGEFTLVFNSFEEESKILRMFCKANIIQEKNIEYNKYLNLFHVNHKIINSIIEFNIYAVEVSCGDGIPYMEYKGERNILKDVLIKMSDENKLESYREKKQVPPNLQNI
jgi:hypothetical protein